MGARCRPGPLRDHDTICKFCREKLASKRPRAKYEAKKAERREKAKKTGKKFTGREPKRPEKKAEDSHEQCNPSDPDARIMRKNKRASFTQSYNAQAAMDADGNQLVVGQHVSRSASDYAELENGEGSIPSQLGKPEAVLSRFKVRRPGPFFSGGNLGRYVGLWFSRSKLLKHFSKSSLRGYELENSSSTRLTLALIRTAVLKGFKRT